MVAERNNWQQHDVTDRYQYILNFSEISGNLLKNFFTVLIITIYIYSKTNVFLTNNSPDLYALSLHIMFKKPLVLALRRPRDISKIERKL